MKALIANLCLLVSSVGCVNAEVLGFFETENGVQGVVKSEKVGCHAVNINLSSEGKSNKTKEVFSKDCEWQLDGDEVKSEKFPRDGKIRGKVVKVSVNGGNYYLSIFGTTFFTKDSAKVYYMDTSGVLKEFKLGMAGGELKGFKVLKNAVELFVYERKTYAKIEKGRKLSGISKVGRNKLIVVGKNGVESVKEFNSNDSEVYWIEDNSVFKIGRDLRIAKVEAKGL